MKSDFDKAILKAELFATRAVVVTLSFQDVLIKSKTTKVDGTEIKDTFQISADTIGEEFLDYLNDQKIPHAVIYNDKSSLTFALPREEDGGFFKNNEARKVVAGFFNSKRQNAIASEAYYQTTDSFEHVKNTILSPFSKTRRDVNKAVKKLTR